jgi:hypothetical protein
LHIAAQIADIHVRAAFELGDGGLPDIELARQLLLRPLARGTQFEQRHRGFQL